MFEAGTPARVLLLSNGHGEDVIGAKLARELQRQAPALQVSAFPVVGLGEAYAAAGIEVVGPRRRLPSGGLLMHSMPLFLADLRAGFLRLTTSQYAFLLGSRSDMVIAVGDIYAQLLASLVRARTRFVVQTLVSARHAQGSDGVSPNRLFMERITAVERLLMRTRARRVYVRDDVTEEKLRELGVRGARFLGNPVADGLQGTPPASLTGSNRVVALLPGSRAYRTEALNAMLDTLAQLESLQPLGAAAWIGELPPAPAGWRSLPPQDQDRGLLGEFRRGPLRVLFFRERLADVLSAARVALGTAGTAHEQAVAVGVPVVSFPVPPHFSQRFLANQKRLLGPALLVCDGAGSEVAAALSGWLEDPARAQLAGKQGAARIGPAGGSAAIAADILAHWQA